jgi:hypothetical protein
MAGDVSLSRRLQRGSSRYESIMSILMSKEFVYLAAGRGMEGSVFDEANFPFHNSVAQLAAIPRPLTPSFDEVSPYLLFLCATK